MATTIRVYRNGVQVGDPYNDPDDGTFSIPVSAAGWTPGTYSITCTAQAAGKSESPASAPQTLTVNASAVISDDFDRADVGPNWTFVPAPWGGGAVPIISGGVVTHGGDAGGLVWSGAQTVGPDRLVSIRLGLGTINYGPGMYVKLNAVDTWMDNRVRIQSQIDSNGVDHLISVQAGDASQYMNAGVVTTDQWARVATVGQNVFWWTSADGVTWTYQGQKGCPGTEGFTTQPKMWFHGNTGTAANVFFDNFRAETIDPTVKPNLVSQAVARNVGLVAQGWTVSDALSRWTITPGQADPAGGSNGVNFVTTTSNGSSTVTAPQITGLTPGSDYVMSCWFKRNTSVTTGVAPVLNAVFPTNSSLDTGWYGGGNMEGFMPVGKWVRLVIKWVQGSDTVVTPTIQQFDGPMDVTVYGLKVEQNWLVTGTAANI